MGRRTHAAERQKNLFRNPCPDRQTEAPPHAELLEQLVADGGHGRERSADCRRSHKKIISDPWFSWNAVVWRPASPPGGGGNASSLARNLGLPSCVPPTGSVAAGGRFESGTPATRHSRRIAVGGKEGWPAQFRKSSHPSGRGFGRPRGRVWADDSHRTDSNRRPAVYRDGQPSFFMPVFDGKPRVLACQSRRSAK